MKGLQKKNINSSHSSLPLLGQKEYNFLYCSLDIETTGFDPLKDEVLEVGFVFFEVNKKGIVLNEEYTQVFKPSREVPAKILGLTGISQKELDEASKFSEHREVIQTKLKDSVIVGHNIIFDIKFLESLGIKFSGLTIDTLDLVQWLLPTHHSYNLENLMHFFGISHKDAHRALADAKASLQVLEKLLGIYSGLSTNLKINIERLIQGKNFVWESFLAFKFPKTAIGYENKSPKRVLGGNSALSWDALKNKHIYNIPFGLNISEQILPTLNKAKKKTLLVVPKKQQVLKLSEDFGIEPVFDEDDCFDEKKFIDFVSRPELSTDETKFILKVLVWQEQNPESQNLLDLNLSFFGGQFKNLINGKVSSEPKSKVACIDHKTFLYLAKLGKLSKRFVVVAGLFEFETSVTFGIGYRVGWGALIYFLKSYYNPENPTNSEIYKEPVEELFKATDMFFGLTMVLLNKQETTFNNIKITSEFTYSQEYGKVQKASESFLEKIKIYNQILKSEKLESFVQNLTQFFLNEKNTVKWIEISEKTCVFQSAPIDIRSLLFDLMEKFSGFTFLDSVHSPKVFEYFVIRLGLQKFKKLNLQLESKRNSQTDLFSQKHTVDCSIQNLDDQKLLQVIKAENLPATILFGSQIAVKEFYEQNYQLLKEYAFLQAQSASGGSNKMLNNFSIHNNSLLLATDKFILKFISGNTSTASKGHLDVKTLVLGRLPFEQFTHPYQEAVSAQFENAFIDFALPRALINFHKLLEFFYSENLKGLYITDIKMQKEYGKYFKDYLSVLDSFKIKN